MKMLIVLVSFFTSHAFATSQIMEGYYKFQGSMTWLKMNSKTKQLVPYGNGVIVRDGLQASFYDKENLKKFHFQYTKAYRGEGIAFVSLTEITNDNSGYPTVENRRTVNFGWWNKNKIEKETNTMIFTKDKLNTSTYSLKLENGDWPANTIFTIAEHPSESSDKIHYTTDQQGDLQSLNFPKDVIDVQVDSHFTKIEEKEFIATLPPTVVSFLTRFSELHQNVLRAQNSLAECKKTFSDCSLQQKSLEEASLKRVLHWHTLIEKDVEGLKPRPLPQPGAPSASQGQYEYRYPTPTKYQVPPIYFCPHPGYGFKTQFYSYVGYFSYCGCN